MEYEEQKPKDIILNEREIKQETSDFLENVKEEPLEDEHSELIIPKQETEESLEHVKEEPINEEYFDQIIPKQDFSELLVPKRETEGSLENVKEEPIDEEDYSELLVTKHEEVIESSASYISKNSVQKFSIETQEDVPNLDVEQRRKSSVKCHRCSICLQKYPRQDVKYVRMEEDSLVTLIGCILRGSYTLEQARLFMSDRGRVDICYVHFFESINKIYNVLNIKNNVEINSCSSKLMDNLMVTVNALIPQIETWRFCDILHDFVRRNISQKRTCSSNGALSKMKQNHRCSVCTKNECSKKMKFVTMEKDKLVIMVGSVLRDDYSLDRAQLFMSGKGRVYICHIHFSEALNQIYKALNIKHPDEVSSCSVELTNLMITVNKLCPQIEPCQFQIGLKKFFTKNKYFIRVLGDMKL